MIGAIVAIVLAVLLMVEVYNAGLHRGRIEGLDEAIREMEEVENEIQDNTVHH